MTDLWDLRSHGVLLVALSIWTACSAEEAATGPDRWVEPVILEETLSIGEINGEEEYVFGEVTAVAADDGGRVYVADPIANLVRVYDPNGLYLGDVGRSGEGPGEYRKPVELAFSVDGDMYLESALLVQVFRADDPDGIRDDFVEGRIMDGRPHDYLRRGVVDSRGRYLQPAQVLRGEEVLGWYMFHEGLYPDLSPLEVPQYPGMRRGGVARYTVYRDPNSPAYSAVVVPGLAAAPFEAIPSWTATVDATVIGGTGDRPVLYETDFEGDTLRTITWPRPRRAVPEAEHADSTSALRDRIAAIEVPLSQVDNASPAALSGEPPDSLPLFIGVYREHPSGRLWVEVWPEEVDTRLFDVLGPGGDYIESVQLPGKVAKEPAVFITRGAVYGVVRDPETEVDRVVRLARTGTGPRGGA